MSKAYLIRTLLHTHLPLHLQNLLFLAESQRPRHTQQQSAGADHPQRLAAEAQSRGRPCVARFGGRVEALAVCGGDDVFEGVDSVEEGLVEFIVVYVGDF